MPTERQGQQAQGESLVPGAEGKTSGGRELEWSLGGRDTLGLRRKRINFMEVHGSSFHWEKASSNVEYGSPCHLPQDRDKIPSCPLFLQAV